MAPYTAGIPWDSQELGTNINLCILIWRCKDIFTWLFIPPAVSLNAPSPWYCPLVIQGCLRPSPTNTFYFSNPFTQGSNSPFLRRLTLPYVSGAGASGPTCYLSCPYSIPFQMKSFGDKTLNAMIPTGDSPAVCRVGGGNSWGQEGNRLIWKCTWEHPFTPQGHCLGLQSTPLKLAPVDGRRSSGCAHQGTARKSVGSTRRTECVSPPSPRSSTEATGQIVLLHREGWSQASLTVYLRMLCGILSVTFADGITAWTDTEPVTCWRTLKGERPR